MLDADLYLDGSMDVAGWHLWLPKREDLDAVIPIPGAAGHRSSRGWEPLLYEQSSWILSCNDSGASPKRSALFPGYLLSDLFEPEDSGISAWQPLLLLNLYSLNPVNVVSEYEVEPGRYSDRVHGQGLVSEPVGIDGEYEIVSHGPFIMSEDETPGFSRFLAVMSDCLGTWKLDSSGGQAPKKKKENPIPSLRPSAERFMSLNPWIGRDGDVVFPGRRAEVIFWYITTLEHLVTTGETVQGEVIRRVAQRTAVLVGRNDNDRLHIERLVRKGYGTRSTLAHGGTPDQKGLRELAEGLRDVVRRALIRRIILGPALKIAVTCDQALLSTKKRQTLIESPISEAAVKLRGQETGREHLTDNQAEADES